MEGKCGSPNLLRKGDVMYKVKNLSLSPVIKKIVASGKIIMELGQGVLDGKKIPTK